MVLPAGPGRISVANSHAPSRSHTRSTVTRFDCVRHACTLIQAVALSLLKHTFLSSFSSPGIFKRVTSQPHAWLSQCSTSELKCPNALLQLSSRHKNGCSVPSSIQSRIKPGSMRPVRIWACRSRSMYSGEYHHLPRHRMSFAGSWKLGHLPDSRWLIRLE
jgi:hypothetical protein